MSHPARDPRDQRGIDGKARAFGCRQMICQPFRNIAEAAA